MLQKIVGISQRTQAMIDDTRSDKIEAWLKGGLSPSEARAFEAEMASNPSLAEEVEQHRLVQQALDRLAEMKMQEHVSRWQENPDALPKPPDLPGKEDEREKKRKKRIRRLLGLALLLIISAGAIRLLWPPGRAGTETNPGTPDTEKEQSPAQPQTPVAVAPGSSPGKDTGAPVISPKQPARQNANTGRPPIQDINRDAYPDMVSETRIHLYDTALTALAGERLEGLRKSIDSQYGRTMAVQDHSDASFKAGLVAFKSNRPREAMDNLRNIQPGNPAFVPARELLALICFDAGDFDAAARYYEEFAAQSPGRPEVDWRLAQFYLAAYKTRKDDFWKTMQEIMDPAAPHKYKAQAEALKNELEAKGVRKE